MTPRRSALIPMELGRIPNSLRLTGYSPVLTLDMGRFRRGRAWLAMARWISRCMGYRALNTARYRTLVPADPSHGTAASAGLFMCAKCHAQELIFSCCNRSQVYCAARARRRTRRDPDRRYQTSRRGRLAHAERSCRYRIPVQECDASRFTERCIGLRRPSPAAFFAL